MVCLLVVMFCKFLALNLLYDFFQLIKRQHKHAFKNIPGADELVLAYQ